MPKYTEGNKRHTYPAGSTGPGGGSAMSYSTGRRDHSASALTETRRGDFTPTVRDPQPSSHKGGFTGSQPFAHRVSAGQHGDKPRSNSEARVGDAGGSPKRHTAGGIYSEKNEGARSAAYSTPSPKTMKVTR